MEQMLNKLKKFMVVTAAAVMLSTGFATAAPSEVHAAHWADKQMNWAFKREIITADLRDNLATRQDTWLMVTRTVLGGKFNIDYDSAREYAITMGISDGSRGTNWVTRSEAAAMVLHMHGYYQDIQWDPKWGYVYVDYEAEGLGIFDGTRGNDFATRAEVVAMIYNAPWTH
ncbi:hypothetical protein [Bacillus wiedmannii]|uniref:hypothetical protein n=1 Tax=Bacillus wiedmannii TaxID=1890302 RepID=UPI0006DA32C6|nr:hypothetical protein [Bacillus wiedmannii]KPU55610.1 hypothetical protein AN402_3625 [Bacillus wiedmannii]